MFCLRCAAPLPTDGSTCAACGTSLPRGGSAEPQIAVGPPPHNQTHASESRSNVSAGATGHGRRALPRIGGRGPSRRSMIKGLLYVLPLVLVVSAGATFASGAWSEREWYARAAAAEADGRLPEAIDAYEAANGYRDAEARRSAVVAKLAPYRAAVVEGVAALDAARYDAAIASLLPVARELPTYEHAALLLAQARSAREADLRRQVETATGHHDWLTVERLLATLAAEDPSDTDLATRLGEIRRQHAPMVFARDDALYLAGPDLADERLITDAVPVAWPLWSPDRSRIAFVSDGASSSLNGALYVINADGTGLKRLVDGASPRSLPMWSPDGTRLLYTSFANYDRTTDAGSITVRMVDVATGHETDLTGDRFRPGGRFRLGGGRFRYANGASWSPTGDRVAFVSRTLPSNSLSGFNFGPGDVFVLTLATGKIVNVSHGRLPDAWRVTWSPTDDRLLIWNREDQTWSDPYRTSISLLDVTTGTLTDVNSTSASTMMPVWSPNGSRFAYVEGEDEDSMTVRIRGAFPGDAYVKMPTAISGYLSWSPDGGTLLAAGDPLGSSYLISLVDGVGTPEELRLTYDNDSYVASPPQWSARNPVPMPSIPSVEGTGLDYGGDR